MNSQNMGHVHPHRAGWGIRATLLLALALVVAGMFGAAGAHASECKDEYTGPSGGSWAQASNWSAGLPVQETSVCWSAGKQVVVPEGSYGAAWVTTGGSLLVRGSLDLDDEGANSQLSEVVEVADGGSLFIAGGIASPAVDVVGGRLRVGVLPAELGGQVTLTEGGVLEGDAQLSGNLENLDGEVHPSHAGMTVAGDYSQGPHSTLAVDIQSSAGPEASGELTVHGTAQLAGTLQLKISFDGVAGDAAPVLATAARPVGGFASLAGQAAGSVPWALQYGAGGVSAAVFEAGFLTPLVLGKASEGEVLTCEAEPSASSDAAEQWLRGGAPIGGAEGSSYTVSSRDIGASLSCAATVQTAVLAGSFLQTRTATFTSPATAPVTGRTGVLSVPDVTGPTIVGGVLSCSPGQWLGAPDEYTYQWLRGGVAVGATGPTYRVTAADEGHAISCAVSAHWGLVSATQTSSRLTIPSQASLCLKTGFGLVSVRPAGAHLELVGAAPAEDVGQTVSFRVRAPGSRRWRRLTGGATVTADGLFRASLARPVGAGGLQYEALLGAKASAAVRIPTGLRILSLHSAAGASEVTLGDTGRLAGRLTIRHLRSCEPGARVIYAPLTPRAPIMVRLQAPPGGVAVYEAGLRTAAGIHTVRIVVSSSG